MTFSSIHHLTPPRQNQEPNELRGHTDSIHSLAWDPTNPLRLASTGADKTVRVWDVKTCKIAHSISLQSEALNIVYSFDGKFIAVSNLDCVTLIDTRKNRVVRRVVNPYEVNEVQFSKSGFLFVAAGSSCWQVLRCTKRVTAPHHYQHAPSHRTCCWLRHLRDLAHRDREQGRSQPGERAQGTRGLRRKVKHCCVADCGSVAQVVAHAGSCFCLDFHPSGRCVETPHHVLLLFAAMNGPNASACVRSGSWRWAGSTRS